MYALYIFYIDGDIEMDKDKEIYKPLFMSDDDWQNNACINEKVTHDFDLFAEGYKTGADILVSHVIEKSSDQDLLVYPIVFLYRHHLELRLKEIIREGNRLLGTYEDFRHCHDLNKLWIPAKKVVKEIWPEGDPEEFIFIEHVINEISTVDSQSYSFRYPEDKSGNNPLSGISHINLRHLAEMIEKVYIFLYGVSAAICDYNESY